MILIKRALKLLDDILGGKIWIVIFVGTTIGALALGMAQCANAILK